MGITVENGGILTTVQDEGRFGNQAFGVSTSGAMDPRAFHIANLLVGNKKTEGALEMTFIGPTLTFTSDNSGDRWRSDTDAGWTAFSDV